MDGKMQPITSSAAAAARQVVGALSAGHVQRHGAPRPPAPGSDAKRQATAASPAFVAARQATPTMIAKEHEVVRDRAGQMAFQMKQTAVATTFKRKHAELSAVAASFAAEFGADVCIYAVPRDGTHGRCVKFPGTTGRPGGQQAAAIRQLLGKDVAMMGLGDAKAHEARLLELRAAVVRKLQEIETAKAAAAPRPNKIIRLE